MIIPVDATHYQRQQNAYYKLVRLDWFVWSKIEQEPCHWIPSPATQEKYLEIIK